MLHTINSDLHIHTCLSPCSSLDMSPRKIAEEASKKGLSIIAVTDHNSAENIEAVSKASENHNITVIPGIEITSSEEVHTIALFESVKDSLSVQEIIFNNLQPGENDEDFFGLQVLSNELDEVEGFNKRLLAGATKLSVNEIIITIHQYGGLAIAAHIDRMSFSIISQLGFIPDELEFDALEISRNLTLKEAFSKYKEYSRFPFIQSSDSHELNTIGSGSIKLMMEEPSFKELKMAFKGKNGRKIIT
ncbi:MAG: PHP domain-containing protein [Spirochaetes bacterium]|nr:PHP domain-containing protein [Spirochaetota bacterium]